MFRLSTLQRLRRRSLPKDAWLQFMLRLIFGWSYSLKTGWFVSFLGGWKSSRRSVEGGPRSAVSRPATREHSSAELDVSANLFTGFGSQFLIIILDLRAYTRSIVIKELRDDSYFCINGLNFQVLLMYR